MISTVQAQWNSATMPLQIEKACAAEANSRLELGKVRRTAEPLPAKVRRGEIDFRLRAGGTIPSLKSRLSNNSYLDPSPHIPKAETAKPNVMGLVLARNYFILFQSLPN